MKQGTQEWHEARKGLITASRAADMMISGRGNQMFGKTAIGYATDLILARIGVEVENITTWQMEWGIEHEPEARDIYHKQVAAVVEVGFVIHPDFNFIGCSPDGLIGNEGEIEIKCPQERAHLLHLLSDDPPKNYWYQMQFQMMVTGRKWCDFISFHPYFPDNVMFKKIRVMADLNIQKDMLNRAIAMNYYINEQIKKL